MENCLRECPQIGSSLQKLSDGLRSYWLADDHTVMRSGLRALLERQDNLEIVGEVENGRDAVSLSASGAATRNHAALYLTQ
jgi:hypothetical protein